MFDENRFVSRLIEADFVHVHPHQQQSPSAAPFQVFFVRTITLEMRIESGAVIANEEPGRAIIDDDFKSDLSITIR